jgi:nitrite reductase/ring-hydroxylating ferredoxin subunit
MAFRKLAKLNDIEPGKSKAIQVGEKHIAVFNVENKFYAVDEICPHKGGPLAEGGVQELNVTCPWHAAVFSLETDKGISGPCGNGVHHYETRASGEDLEIDIGDA